jgi:hypothetical protein
MLRVERVSSNMDIFESTGLRGISKRRFLRNSSEGPHRNLELSLCFGGTPRF